MKKSNVHADLCDEPGKVVPACGKTYETGLEQFDIFIPRQTFGEYVCREWEVKCADCEGAIT